MGANQRENWVTPCLFIVDVIYILFKMSIFVSD